MESMGNRLKIVWVCHFMNQPIQKLLGMDGQEKEFAPWIPLGIEEIKKRDDIELYVIAPFYGIFSNRSFSEKNIHYHCIRVGVPFFRRTWPPGFRIDLWTNFRMFNLQVKNLIERIDPDVVDLKGAENAYYSSSVFSIKRRPILVTIQGFISLNYQSDSKDPYIKRRLQIEEKILTEMKYFGVEAKFMEQYIKNINPTSRIFFYHCPYTKLDINTDVAKEYDLVFFARIDKRKGIEDLINALSIVKTRNPKVSLIIIGRGDESYINHLKQMTAERGLGNNVIFRGFIPTQKEMLDEVVKARISVLPTYNDTIPGTIIESMHLRIPAISYSVGGNPDLNLSDENLILVGKGNVEQLAFEIDRLLGNKKKQLELAEKAFKFASVEFDNSIAIDTAGSGLQKYY